MKRERLTGGYGESVSVQLQSTAWISLQARLIYDKHQISIKNKSETNNFNSSLDRKKTKKKNRRTECFVDNCYLHCGVCLSDFTNTVRFAVTKKLREDKGGSQTTTELLFSFVTTADDRVQIFLLLHCYDPHLPIPQPHPQRPLHTGCVTNQQHENAFKS